MVIPFTKTFKMDYYMPKCDIFGNLIKLQFPISGGGGKYPFYPIRRVNFNFRACTSTINFGAFETILTMYHTYRSDKVAISHIKGVNAPFTLLGG